MSVGGPPAWIPAMQHSCVLPLQHAGLPGGRCGCKEQPETWARGLGGGQCLQRAHTSTSQTHRSSDLSVLLRRRTPGARERRQWVAYVRPHAYVSLPPFLSTFHGGSASFTNVQLTPSILSPCSVSLSSRSSYFLQRNWIFLHHRENTH